MATLIILIMAFEAHLSCHHYWELVCLSVTESMAWCVCDEVPQFSQYMEKPWNKHFVLSINFKLFLENVKKTEAWIKLYNN
jgi:hypothetical protein